MANRLCSLLCRSRGGQLRLYVPRGYAANAIIFGTGRIRMQQMIRAGLVLNVPGILRLACLPIFFAADARPFDHAVTNGLDTAAHPGRG